MDAPDEAKGPAGPSFEVREATTVEKGGRRRGLRTAGGTPAPQETFQVREAVTTGETPAPLDAPPGESFQVREAATKTLDPPHWAELKKPEEAPEMEMSPAAPVEDKEE